MTNRKTDVSINLLLSTAIFCAVGCEDLLPEYRQPSNVLISSIKVDTFTVQYLETERWYPELNGPLIDYSSYSPDYRFYFFIINNYDETIDVTADLNGKIEFWQDQRPENKATFNISNSDLPSDESYNSTTNRITIDPGKALTVLKQWNYKMDDDKWVHKTGLEITGKEDKPRFFYTIYYRPALFHLRSAIALNKSMPAIVSETTFVFTLVGRFRPSP